MGAASNHTLANDRDLKATTVPATACMVTFYASPADTQGPGFPWPSQGGALIVFPRRAPESGGLGGPYTPPPNDYRFQCALPLNALEKSTTAGDNDMTSFRVLYFDGDGAAPGMQVRVTLHRTTLLGSGAYDDRPICSWSSSAATTAWTRATSPCVHDLGSGGALYRFEVSLFTSVVGALGGPYHAGFAGIDFP